MRALNYTYELVRCRKVLRLPVRDVGPILSRYRDWSGSVKSGLSPIELGLPWMVYQSLDFLKDFCRPGDRVFEYSSGGSTIFFAGLGLRGVSIEHDADWAKRVESELERSLPDADWQILVVPPNPASSDVERRFRSSSDFYRDFSFVDYVTALAAYPKNHFALIAVDGRARNACIEMACNHVAPGGVLLIDNSDRQEYWAQIDRLKENGWQSREFTGPLPASAAFCRTTILRRPL
jgi:hypothetical protein